MWSTAYRKLSEVRQLLPGVPVLALTATATPRVQDDIVRQLRLAPNHVKLCEGFNRPNISYKVRLGVGRRCEGGV